MARRKAHDERGSVLIVALVMIMVVAMLASATLAYGGATLRASSSAVGPDHDNTYAAGGATDLAIKYIDQNATVGAVGGSACSNSSAYASLVTVPATGNAPAVTVQCKPDPTSGVTTGGNGGVTDTMPKYSVLALGTNNNMPGPFNPSTLANSFDTTYAERGIDWQKSSTGGSNTVAFSGNVYSNEPIRKGTGAGLISATGTISARGACENTPSSSPACTVVPYSTAATADPGYPYRTPNLTPQTVPTCPTSTSVTFTPGWYNSASALNSLFATCKDHDFWFQPGVYYFDFRDATGGTQCRLQSATAANALHEWCIGPFADSKSHVVGGAPSGWTPNPSPVTIASDFTTGVSYPQVWTNQANGATINNSYATYNWSGTGTDTYMGSIYPTTTVPSTAQDISSVSVDVASALGSGSATRTVWVMWGDPTNIASLTTCGTYSISANSTTISGLESCLDTPAKVNQAVIAVEFNTTTFSGQAKYDGAKLHVTYVPAGVGRAPFPGGCDPNTSGTQFIFGGDSRVYVSDGTFEVCAGPNPSGSTTNQQIAIYGVPGVNPVVPTGTGTISGQTWTTITNASNALTMGEQSGITNATITVQPKCGSSPGNISCFLGSGSGYAYGSIRMDFAPGQFSVPANTTLSDVELHASYNQNSTTFDSDESPEFQVLGYQTSTPLSGCSSDMSMPATNGTEQFWKSIPTTCLTAARLAAGFSIEWRARISASCSFNNCGAAQSNTLDGMELRLQLAPSTPTTAVMIPENGCIAPFPNDYVSNSGDPITNQYGMNNWDDDGAPDCALLMWDAVPRTTGTASQIGCYSGQVSLQGTLYAPDAAVDFDQAGPKSGTCSAASPTYTSWSYPIFGRGAIVRTMRIKGYRDPTPHTAMTCGSSTCGGSANDRLVYLDAQIGGTSKVTAKVLLPADGSAAQIINWTVN